MDVFKTLRPNDAGTKRLTREYGDSLVAVRYRKGINPNNIYTTVEIIVDAKPYIPGVTHVPSPKTRHAQQVPLHIAYQETDMRQRVKAAGAFWDAEQKAWFLEYAKVCEMKLQDRIIKNVGVQI